MKQIRTSAPTRIDLAGGTLDIWPLYLFHEHAQTVNAAISLRAHAEIIERTDGRIRLESIDTSKTVEVGRWQELADSHGLPLLSRLARFFRAENLTLRTRGESPAGAGIAGSSALNVAVCGALAEWAGMKLDGEQLLTIAMNVEAQVINVPTGLQDYRPAYYGGVARHRAAAGRRQARRRSMSILQRCKAASCSPTPARRTSQARTTGKSRSATSTAIAMSSSVSSASPTPPAACATRLAAVIGPAVSTQINLEWEARKKLAPGVTTPMIETLIASAFAAGARAAKVCGAGGGGCLFCVADPGDVPAVRQALQAGGARILDYRIETEGLRVQTA